MNKDEHIITPMFLLLLFGFLCFVAGRHNPKPVEPTEEEIVKTDTLIIRDTMRVDVPIPVASRQLKDSIRFLVALNDRYARLIDSLAEEIGNPPMDTIEVVLPREQKEYGDSTYHAWVSGYDPALDSIRVISRTHYITTTVREVTPPKHWHIGPMVGMGVGAADNKIVMTPYVGIGVTYSIISF